MTATDQRPVTPDAMHAPDEGVRDQPLDLRRLWRVARSPVGIALLFAVVVVTVGVLSAVGPPKPLDPSDPSPDGARALAVLLRDRGVTVHRVTTAPDIGARSDAIVFAPDATRVSRADLRALASAASPVVVGDATSEELALLAAPAQVRGHERVATRDPACTLPAARTAGNARLGGRTYTPASLATAECYAAGGAASLLVVPDRGRTLTLLGSTEFCTNRRLAQHGNAALALGLLSARDVYWLVPPRVAAPEPGAQRKGVLGLLPSGVRWGLLTVAVGIALLALWRARRLGPVVAEPLPVVVRAAETVEGRARLYRASAARGTAAAQLRGAARGRIARSIGLPADPDPAALVEQVAARTARAGSEVGTLLYGAGPGHEPVDDAALVRLAAELDALEAAVRRS